MGKKKKSNTSAAPSALKISRDGSRYVLSWKRGANYNKSQTLHYRLNNGGWINLKIGVKVSSAAVYTSATRIQFRVRGKIDKKKVSGWATSGTYIANLPIIHSVTREFSTSEDLTTDFKWNVNHNPADAYPFTKVEWQSVLLQDSNTNDGSSVDWGHSSLESGTSTIPNGDTAVWTKKESGFDDLITHSYTRWFRLRAHGWAGATNWWHAKRVYGYPKMAENITASRTEVSGGGFSLSIEWNSPASEDRPIDTVQVRYRQSVPNVRVEYPSEDSGTVKMIAECPDDSQDWNAYPDVSGIAGKRAMSIQDANDVGADKILFVQVNNINDSFAKRTTQSTPVMVKNGAGLLLAPSVPNPVASPSQDNLYNVVVNRVSTVNTAIAIYFRTSAEPDKPVCIGVIKPGETSTGCIIPDYPDGSDISFGAMNFIGNYTPYVANSDTEVTIFSIDPMDNGEFVTSSISWGDAVPLPPKNVGVIKINETTARVNWDWSWREATHAELSWSNHKDAWESTNEPSTYIVDSTKAGSWNIANLDIGTWFIRVRLFKQMGDQVVYGTYSDIQTIKLSASPDTPSLVLSPTVISEEGSVTCYWAYVSNDGTAQKQGEVCEAFYQTDEQTGEEMLVYGEPIASTNSAQQITIPAQEHGWRAGETHYLAVRVMSTSGESSEGWSTPVALNIAEPIECHITQTSLVSDYEVPVTDEDPYYCRALTSLPLSVTATGAGVGGTTTFIIERAESYHLDRPDELESKGFEGETIFIYTQNGEDQYSITQENLIGFLDDGCKYNLIVIAQDAYGQTAQDVLSFEVHWAHQAIMPSAEISIDAERHVTFITPIQPPEGYELGDTCDIYRLSVDRPELIVAGAIFGTKYVDPYPAIGEFGGHRIVYRTINGDYILTNDGGGEEIAMEDYTSDEDEYRHDIFGVIIDFDGEQLILPYNVSFNTKWSKDYTTTKYLGGSIQGDWNPAVERSASVSTVIPIEVEPENLEILRRLADYSGICHVRMPDGSSFTANVNVTDNREEKWTPRLSKVSLEISACDSEGFEGLTYAEWIENQEA